MTADDVRARFEAWATERGLLIRRAAMICGRAAGPYDRDEVQSAWNAYRAAHADLSGEVREFLQDCAANANGVHIPDQRSRRALDLIAKLTQEKP